MSTDTTNDFINALDHWDQNPNLNLTNNDLAVLLTDAQSARSATGREWARLTKLLAGRGGFKKKDAASEVNQIKVRAALGCYPYSEAEFIPAYLNTKCYTMSYNEDFVLPNGTAHGMARMM